jgi:hypothetical protein
VTRSMGTRRAAVLAGAATVVTLALSGCSAGQIAETANKEPSVYGINTENADGSVLIRGLAVGYPSVEGYPQGGTAPLELALFNETDRPITVRITSRPPQPPNPLFAWAQQVVLADASPTAGAPAGAEPTATPAPDATPASGAAAGRPAEINLPPLDSAHFLPGYPQRLLLVGLSQPVRAGNSVNLVFEFSNGVEPLTLRAGVAPPSSPAPRVTPTHGEEGEGGH